MPVTSPFCGGITTLERFVLKMDRQPRTSPPETLTLEQPRAPTKSCPSWLICMRSWYPSVMVAEPETAIEAVSITLSLPQVVAAVAVPVQAFVLAGVAGGVPATYRVEPFSKP